MTKTHSVARTALFSGRPTNYDPASQATSILQLGNHDGRLQVHQGVEERVEGSVRRSEFTQQP